MKGVRRWLALIWCSNFLRSWVLLSAPGIIHGCLSWSKMVARQPFPQSGAGVKLAAVHSREFQEMGSTGLVMKLGNRTVSKGTRVVGTRTRFIT